MDAASIVRGLRGDNESSRKLAAFHLQTMVSDGDFADAFIQENGMPALCGMVVHEQGNTLAYALGSLNGILEHGLGWDEVGLDIAERAVDLVVSRPVINVLRNAFRFLVLIVTRYDDETEFQLASSRDSDIGPNLDTLTPILKEQDTFLNVLVERLTSADHALCANALQFLNALIRDGVMAFNEIQLMRFLSHLQALDVFGTVEGLMRSDIVSDIAAPILDFQNLTKVMLRRWRSIPVDITNPAHEEALEKVHSCAEPALPQEATNSRDLEREGSPPIDEPPLDMPTEVTWRSLGFAGEDPVLDMDELGVLGLMDLTDFFNKDSDFVRKTLLEQTVMPIDRRCPVARVCLTATSIIYEQFRAASSSADPRTSRALLHEQLAADIDFAVQPLLLCRDKLHSSIVHAFFRLWEAAGTQTHEYDKIEQLVRLLVAKHIGSATRHTTAQEVEDAMNRVTLAEVRKWQTEELNKLQDRAWGTDLSRLRDRLHEESIQFMQEQRIRCLLEGAWFSTESSSPNDAVDSTSVNSGSAGTASSRWRYARLSPNRRYLHHATYPNRSNDRPSIANMAQKIDVNHISSVVSNVTKSSRNNDRGDAAKHRNALEKEEYATSTRLVIHGSASRGVHGGGNEEEEQVLLELICGESALASEWLDGLLMLLDQQPITADTERLISMIENWSLKVRLLNLQWEDAQRQGNGVMDEKGHGEWSRSIPRPEVEGEYWYDMGED
ncbi:hypothetical protein ANO11243_000560 [Dothideomycetidae sp. 11243]|nr:hypothetical protein ANO11243_000560 [fungal sp. No.11243]